MNGNYDIKEMYTCPTGGQINDIDLLRYMDYSLGYYESEEVHNLTNGRVVYCRYRSGTFRG